MSGGKIAAMPSAISGQTTGRDQNTPTRVIGLKLDRTESAIYSHARSIGLSLLPTNQSPYGRSSGSRSRSRRSL